MAKTLGVLARAAAVAAAVAGSVPMAINANVICPVSNARNAALVGANMVRLAAGLTNASCKRFGAATPLSARIMAAFK